METLRIINLWFNLLTWIIRLLVEIYQFTIPRMNQNSNLTSTKCFIHQRTMLCRKRVSFFWFASTYAMHTWNSFSQSMWLRKHLSSDQRDKNQLINKRPQVVNFPLCSFILLVFSILYYTFSHWRIFLVETPNLISLIRNSACY